MSGWKGIRVRHKTNHGKNGSEVADWEWFCDHPTSVCHNKWLSFGE